MNKIEKLEKRVKRVTAQNTKLLAGIHRLYHNQKFYLERRSKQRKYFAKKEMRMKEIYYFRSKLLKEIGIYRAYSGSRRKDGKRLYWFTNEEIFKMKRILRERWREK